MSDSTMSAGVLMVVDDDAAVTRAIASVGSSLDLDVVVCHSGSDFVDKFRPASPHCIVLDVKMPGTSGIDLLRQLKAEPHVPPIIMISGHGDVRMAVEAMQLGAITFLEKPFGFEELRREISGAIKLEMERQQRADEKVLARKLLKELKPGEHELLELLIAGRSNKQMAAALDMSLRGVEDRRARIMQKLGVESLAELIALVHLACDD